MSSNLIHRPDRQVALTVYSPVSPGDRLTAEVLGSSVAALPKPYSIRGEPEVDGRAIVLIEPLPVPGAEDAHLLYVRVLEQTPVGKTVRTAIIHVALDNRPLVAGQGSSE